MKCELCISISMYVCPCNNVYLCSNHLGVHLEIPGSHSFKKLDFLSSRETESLKAEIIDFVKEIENKKSVVLKNTGRLILYIEKSAKSACGNIDHFLIKFLNLLNLSTIIKSQEKEIENLIASCLQLNNSIISDLELTFMQFFKNELIRQPADFENNPCQERVNNPTPMKKKIKSLDISPEDKTNEPTSILMDKSVSPNVIQISFENKIILLEQKIKYLETSLDESRKREINIMNDSRFLKKTHSSSLKDIQRQFESQIKSLQAKLEIETERATNLKRDLEVKELQYELDCKSWEVKETEFIATIEKCFQNQDALSGTTKKNEKQIKNQENKIIKDLEKNITLLTFKLEGTEKKIKMTEESMKNEVAMMKRDNAILIQKLEFAGRELLDSKAQLENERRQNMNMMNSIGRSRGLSNYNLETQLSKEKNQYLDQIKSLEFIIDLQKVELEKHVELEKQVEIQTQKYSKLEFEIQAIVSDWENKYNKLNAKYLEENKEKNRLKETIAEIKANYQIEIKEIESKLKKKINELEKNIDTIKNKHFEEAQIENQSLESSLAQLKDIYEAEKSRMEAKIQDDKVRADKRYNLMVEDFEERLKLEQDKYEAELNEMDSYYNEKTKIDSQKIEFLEKSLKDNKEQIENMQKVYALTLEKLNLERD